MDPQTWRLPAVAPRRAARDQCGPVAFVAGCQRKMWSNEAPRTMVIAIRCTAMTSQVQPSEPGTRHPHLGPCASTAPDVTVQIQHILRSLLTRGWMRRTTKMLGHVGMHPRRVLVLHRRRPWLTCGLDMLGRWLLAVRLYTPHTVAILQAAIRHTGTQHTPQMFHHMKRLPSGMGCLRFLMLP
mmetsp:Transcript_19655/g.43598  ORF Transcript_19655/g.43598 Transcript_19655/m.43598 type:complete len:183 (-) Transcript_19655:432-980(-)